VAEVTRPTRSLGNMDLPVLPGQKISNTLIMGSCGVGPLPCCFILALVHSLPSSQSLASQSYGRHTEERSSSVIMERPWWNVCVGCMAIVRGHSSLLPLPFRQLPLPFRQLPLHFRLIPVSVSPSMVFLIEPTAEELSTCGSSSAFHSFHFYFIFHYGVMGSRHLPSYFPSYHFHFIYLFRCPIVVYISTLSDRKVPILFFLDFLSGKSPFF